MIPPLPRQDPDYESPEETPLATARWMDSEQVIDEHAIGLDTHPYHVLLGQLIDNHGQKYRIGDAGAQHLLTVSPTGGGKGVSQIIGTLLHYQGNVVVIDPKGENARLTARYRAEKLGQRVVVLDSYGVSGVDETYISSFNPLSMLSLDSIELSDDAGSQANAIVTSVKGNKEPHWDEQATALTKGLILYVKQYEPSKEQTLVRVADLLAHGVIDTEEHKEWEDAVLNRPDLPPPLPSFSNLIDRMRVDETMKAISSVGQMLYEMDAKELAGVLSTARRNLSFVFSEPMEKQLNTTGFDPSDLRDPSKQKLSIYLVLPEYRMAQQKRWLRLLIVTLLQALQKAGPISESEKLKRQTLFLLDEMPVLGHLQELEDAVGYLRGFGGRIWSIIQDLSQLKDLYKDRWQTFVANAGTITAFCNTDEMTTEFFSKRLGECEVLKYEHSSTVNGSDAQTRAGLTQMLTSSGDKGAPDSAFGVQSTQKSGGVSYQHAPKKQTTRLLRADEFARYYATKPHDQKSSEMLLCLKAGEMPMRLQKCFYYLDDELKRRAQRE